MFETVSGTQRQGAIDHQNQVQSGAIENLELRGSSRRKRGGHSTKPLT